MADDIVAHLADMATDHGRHCTHYEGCHVYHLECAALMVCAEIERLQAAGDEMADAATRQQWSRLDVAVAAWQEARRG